MQNTNFTTSPILFVSEFAAIIKHLPHNYSHNNIIVTKDREQKIFNMLMSFIRILTVILHKKQCFQCFPNLIIEYVVSQQILAGKRQESEMDFP